MNRPAMMLLAVGVVAALAWWALAGSMPAYFAAWLFWIGVPMGALPLVMAMEGTGIGSGTGSGTGASPLLPVLRAMLPLLPLGTIFALPLLGGLSGLFAHPGLPQWWTAPLTLALRDGVILIVLSVLALVFWMTPRRPRRALSGLGVLMCLFLGTVLGFDWLLAPQPGLGSSLVGLLLIAGQMALAGAAAGLVLAIGTDARARLPDDAGLLIGLLVAFWFFLQFAQFLVVWSANLPEEAVWYLARLGGSGTAIIAFAAIAALTAIALLPSMLGRIPAAMASISAMVVIALLFVTLLFVLPAFRGTMALTVSDALALLGVGGLIVGAMMLLIPSRREVAQ